MRQVVLAMAALCAAGARADLVVDDGETVDLAVEADAVQTAPIWFAAEAGKLEKSGAGAWTFATAQLPAPARAVVAVREGALDLVVGAPEDPPAPSAALGRAALWFDASKAASRVEGTSVRNTGVATWYDAREERDADGVWGARWLCATARTSWLSNEVDGVWTKTVFHPVAKTFEEMPGVAYVHFNGRQSGSWMGFCEPGTRAERTKNVEGVQHLFLAGYVEGAWGFPVGVLGNVSPFWHPSNTEGALHTYASPNSAAPGLFQGRALLNGAVFDEAATTVTPGPYVYEWDAGDVAGRLGNFFNDRSIWGTAYHRAGGDALGEVIVFTNRLTALEREQVARYLLGKWRPGGAATPAVEVRTAKGATVRVAPGVDARPVGAGTLRLAEAGCAQGYSQTAPFEGATRVEASATLAAGEPQLALRAGDVCTVARDDYDGLVVANAPNAAKAAAGEAALALAADVAVRVAALPETVKTLAVSGAGALVLAAPPPAASGVVNPGEVRAALPNADMEAWTGTGELRLTSATAATLGWRLVAATNVNNFYLNLASLRGKGHWMINGNAPNAFRWDDYPFQGNVVMALKQGCRVENTVSFPSDGDWELTFLTGGRMDGDGQTYAGGWVKLALVDADGAETPIGTALAYVGTAMRRQRFLVRNVKAGAYTLRLDHAVGTGDAHTLLDDFAFRRVTDVSAETLVAPPNADFEQVDMAWAARHARDARHTAAGWTFAQDAATGADPDVCLVTRGMANAGYRAGSARGGVQLALYGNAGAATSAAFTLPAGTWKLRLRRAAVCCTEGAALRWNDRALNRASGVSGELLDGEAVHPFGALDATTAARMAPATLPTAVTLDAPRTVRLRLKGTTAATATVVPCAMVDELAFVRQDAGGELVANGVFANASSWTLRDNRDDSTAAASGNTEKSRASVADPCRTVGEKQEQAYGSSYGVNARALDICQCASAEQALAFPAAGTYRLVFSARSRLWNYANALPSRTWAGNQASFYLVDAAGATNEIFRTPSLYASNFVFRSALFDVPRAGTYVFGIRGLNGLPQADGTTLQVGANASDTEFFVDQVSVKPAPSAPLDLDAALALDLGEATALRLDFTGTNELARLRLGGVSVAGFVDASHASGLVSGTGCLFVRPKGTVLLLR